MLVEDVLNTIDSDTRPFWEATKRRELLIQYCPTCNTHQFYPRIVCKNCLSDVEWTTSKGKGTLYSFSEVQKVFNPDFKEKVPFIVAMVELDEGPRMLTNLVGAEIEDVKIGMKVQVDFSESFGEYNLVQFRPV
ncbi:Zn-ribbon domain-containing OB-fold protein [Neobacillus mesonae]|uniref:Zn-ribbon domain-containing OB-fold protein n=1 Tax=Neobacillus mesonae TaxID=1193713 RepID=UPI00203B03D5|nr:Zn-ribbon domain-containing OB-fold protein [Neobacillus mesonae]MCM3567498.1 Zn-ribbon domain-containing OB-fold protein [Neobacillus mesonae]